MYERPCGLRGHIWHAHQMKYSDMFGICHGNPCDRAEFANAIGRADCSDAANPRVSVGGICGIQFVATSNLVYATELNDGIVLWKGVISGYSKDLGYSERLKACERVFNNCDGHFIFPLLLEINRVDACFFPC